jgi:hypothetical protein
MTPGLMELIPGSGCCGHPNLVGPLGERIRHLTAGDLRAGLEAEQFLGGHARELSLELRIQRGLHVAGHAGDDHPGAARLDHPAEFVDAQRDTQQVDGKHRLRGRLLRRQPGGVHDRRDPAGRLGRLGHRGH